MADFRIISICAHRRALLGPGKFPSRPNESGWGSSVCIRTRDHCAPSWVNDLQKRRGLLEVEWGGLKAGSPQGSVPEGLRDSD
jgi:hypothetical protein